MFNATDPNTNVVTTAYCKLGSSSANWINVLTNLSACVLLAWAVIKFVAEAVLNSEQKQKLAPHFADKVNLADALVSGEINPVIVHENGTDHKLSIVLQPMDQTPEAPETADNKTHDADEK